MSRMRADLGEVKAALFDLRRLDSAKAGEFQE